MSRVIAQAPRLAINKGMKAEEKGCRAMTTLEPQTTYHLIEVYFSTGAQRRGKVVAPLGEGVVGKRTQIESEFLIAIIAQAIDRTRLHGIAHPFAGDLCAVFHGERHPAYCAHRR